MNIFHWIKNIGTKQSAVNRALTLFLPLGQGISTSADYATLAKEGFTQNSVVFSCIKEIANAAAGVDWILYQRLADGGRKEILSHPLLNLIERPNPLQGKFEFIESAIEFCFPRCFRDAGESGF
jgi:phage portal protein BeeE